ncbi:MAG TPA: KGG domain-containing protein [Rickettsia endosymbiont of Pyrocoelia pectoralis]|nr:KGG domain-containing protein [Rickettsia endosymbiont of Pyrocoelia pectoralis]
MTNKDNNHNDKNHTNKGDNHDHNKSKSHHEKNDHDKHDNKHKNKYDEEHYGKQGFASMPKEQVKEIASKGGQASHKGSNNDDDK